MKQTLRLPTTRRRGPRPTSKARGFIDLIENVRSKRFSWTRRGELSVHMFFGRRRSSFFLAQQLDLRDEVVYPLPRAALRGQPARANVSLFIDEHLHMARLRIRLLLKGTPEQRVAGKDLIASFSNYWQAKTQLAELLVGSLPFHAELR